MTSAESIFCGRKVVLCDASDAMLEAVSGFGPSEILVYSRERRRGERPNRPNIYFETYEDPNQLLQNNGEIIALSGRSARVLYGGKGRTTEGKTYCIAASGWSIGFIAALARHFRKRRLGFVGAFSLPGAPLGERYWLAFEGKSASVRPHTWYVNRQAGLPALLRYIDQFNYVILREDLDQKSLNDSRDLDILVSDLDAAGLTGLLSSQLGWYPVDIFSESPAGGILYRGLPYFPPHLAARLLASAIQGSCGERRPAPRERLLGYYYHLVFPKQAGMWWWNPAFSTERERKMRMIRKFASEAEMAVPSDPAEMIEILKREEWLPALDLMREYAESDEWLSGQFRTSYPKARPGLCAIVARDIIDRYDLQDRLLTLYSQHGFQIIHDIKLDDNLRRQAKQYIRGGNWEDPATDVHNGGPHRLIVAIDPNPLPVSKSTKRLRPRLDNERLRTKIEIRSLLAEERGIGDSASLFHVSDNSEEALDYIRIINSGLHDQLYHEFMHLGDANTP